MNCHIWFLSILLLAVLTPTSGNAQVSTNTEQWHIFKPGKPGSFSVILVPSKTNYISGKPINLHILVKNVGSEEADAAFNYSVTLYDVSVTTTNGLNVPPTTHGKQHISNSRTGGSATNTGFKPGETKVTSADYPLSELYDLSSPNTYKIKVARRFPIGLDNTKNATIWEKVISNEIEITVVPPPAK